MIALDMPLLVMVGAQASATLAILALSAASMPSSKPSFLEQRAPSAVLELNVVLIFAMISPSPSRRLFSVARRKYNCPVARPVPTAGAAARGPARLRRAVPRAREH